MKNFKAICVPHYTRYLLNPADIYDDDLELVQEILGSKNKIDAFLLCTDSCKEYFQNKQDIFIYKNAITFATIQTASSITKSQDFILKEVKHDRIRNLRTIDCILAEDVKRLEIKKFINKMNNLLYLQTYNAFKFNKNYSNQAHQLFFQKESLNESKGCQLDMTQESTCDRTIELSNHYPQNNIKSDILSKCTLQASKINFDKFLILNKVPVTKVQNSKPIACINSKLTEIKPSTYRNSYLSHIESPPSFEEKNDVLNLTSFDMHHNEDLIKSDSLENALEEIDNPQVFKPPHLIICLNEDISKIIKPEEEFMKVIGVSANDFLKMTNLIYSNLSKIEYNINIDDEEPSNLGGIICVKLNFLNKLLQSQDYQRICTLLQLIKNRFNIYLFTYSDEEQEKQNKVIDLFSSKLPILGQILISANEKVSKKYDSQKKRFICTVREDRENWYDYIEIDKNHLFYVYEESGKLIILRDDETLEYDDFFEGIEKMYEGEVDLQIAMNQIEMSDTNEDFVRNASEFEIVSPEEITLKNFPECQFFLDKNGSAKMYIGKSSSCNLLKKEEIPEFIENVTVIGFKLYQYFGVLAPNYCLSRQTSNTNLSHPNKSINDSQFLVMIQINDEYINFDELFLFQYKHNKNHYFYPGDLSDGPLIGFGSAIFLSCIFDDFHFFGYNGRNVGLIKRNGYFEFVKISIDGVLFSNNSIHAFNNQQQSHEHPLVSFNGITLAFENLCENDKLEFIQMLSKFRDADNICEEIWNQYNETKYKEKIKELQIDWNNRREKILEKLSKIADCWIKAHNKSSLNSENIITKNFLKNLINPISLTVPVESKQNECFETEIKYINEKKIFLYPDYEILTRGFVAQNPTQQVATKRIFENTRISPQNRMNTGFKSSDELDIEELNKEIDELMCLAKNIRSPHLVKYQDYQILKATEKNAYQLDLIMEYCDGNLTRYEKNHLKKKMSERLFRCYGILAQIVEGLCALHNNGIAHKNLKPQNVLYRKLKINEEELIVWKIADFGLDSIRKKFNITMKNSLYTASSEQSGELDSKAADIWALGLIFHRMIFGYDYFEKHYLDEIYKLSPKEINMIDEETNFLLFEMLEINPAKRITAEQIQATLKKHKAYDQIQKINKLSKIILDEENTYNKELLLLSSNQLFNLKTVNDLLNRGKKMLDKCNSNTAINLFMNAWLVLQRTGVPETNFIYAHIFHYIGLSYFWQQQFEESLNYLNHALKIALLIFGDDNIQLCPLYLSIASVFEYTKEFKESLQNYNKIFLLTKKYYGENFLKLTDLSQKITSITNKIKSPFKF